MPFRKRLHGIQRQRTSLFKEGDVTCIPRNIPHTTYSSPGTESRWSYLFLSTQDLFKRVAPELQGFDLSLSAYKEYRHILSREEFPYIYELTTMIIREIEFCPPLQNQLHGPSAVPVH